ncbi:response regulator [Variovorax ureilyticus]|uniref:response regulator n=1 Tax=Variovorax ureilyticus TaxID=1836198 RepID=UPI003D66E0E0
MNKRVIVADDHPIIRAGVRMVLESATNISVVAEADSPEALLSTLRETPADLLITDFSMPGGQEADGLGLLQRIRRLYPDLPIIVLTMVGNVGVIGAILGTGVRGLIDKSAGMAEISLAIQAVGQGRDYVSTTFKQSLLQSQFNSEAGVAARLSPREVEVLRLFASGMTVSAIADRLSRSVKTVSRQKTDAMSKLGLKSDLEIYAFAREHNLIS